MKRLEFTKTFILGIGSLAVLPSIIFDNSSEIYSVEDLKKVSELFHNMDISFQIWDNDIIFKDHQNNTNLSKTVLKTINFNHVKYDYKTHLDWGLATSEVITVPLEKYVINFKIREDRNMFLRNLHFVVGTELTTYILDNVHHDSIWNMGKATNENNKNIKWMISTNSKENNIRSSNTAYITV